MNINKTIKDLIKKWGWTIPDTAKEDITAILKTQEQEHQKVKDFLIESHAFDMKELKEKHQKKLKEINEFGGDETDAYNLIDKLNEEK